MTLLAIGAGVFSLSVLWMAWRVWLWAHNDMQRAKRLNDREQP